MWITILICGQYRGLFEPRFLDALVHLRDPHWMTNRTVPERSIMIVGTHRGEPLTPVSGLAVPVDLEHNCWSVITCLLHPGSPYQDWLLVESRGPK